MTGWLKQSTSVSVVIGPVWATADGALKADLAYNASGINCDVYKNGTKADVTLANSAGDGYFRAASGEALYLLTLSTGHTDTLGAFTISLSATGYYMKPQHYMVVPANVWDSMFGSDTLKCEVVEISGDTAAADNLESYCDGTTPIPANAIQISDDATAADNCELMFDGTGYAGGTTKLAVEVNTKTGFSLANGSIAAATFAAGALDAAALAADAGTEIGAAVKTAIEAAGSHLTLIKAKTDNLPANTSTVLGTPAGASLAADVAAVKSDSAAILVDTGTTLDTLIKDIPTVAEFEARTIAAADYLIASDTLARVTLVDTTTTNTDMVAAAPSAATIADAVWDEAVADHAGVGSTGAGLAAASSAGDPWATEIPGAYGAGTAGKILGDNINAPIGTVDTVVDAIKAVTDNLPNSGALTDLATAAALATVDGIVDDILVDTGTTLPGTLSTMDGKLDTIDNFIDTEVAAILEDTGTTLPATLATIEGKIDTADAVADAIKVVTDAIGATGSGLSAVPWNAAWDAEVQSECTDALNAYDPPTKAELDAADDATLAAIAALSIPTATENADALLGRNIAGGSSTGRTVTQALRALRNKVGIADGTMTVYAEDDTTESWTAALTTSASAEPITEIDPA